MIYIFLSTIFIFIIYRLFKMGELSFELFFVWEFIGGILLIVSIFPCLADGVIRLVIGGKRSSHFLFSMAIFTLFFIVINHSVKLRRNNKKLEKIIREMSLKNVQCLKVTETHEPTEKRDDFSEHNKKILVKMAAFNEGKNIGAVLASLPETVDKLVIDDGSLDRTFQISEGYRAIVIRHAFNIGQGAADVTGFKYALEHDYDYIIEMDADGQHDAADIPKFIKALDETGDDIITGSRILGTTNATNSKIRNIFLPYYTRFLNRLTGYSLTDSMCGYKAFRAESLRNNKDVFEEISEPQYLASELYIRLAKRGFTVSEIPITIDKRLNGLSTKGLFKYGFKVLKVMIRAWFVVKIVPKI